MHDETGYQTENRSILGIRRGCMLGVPCFRARRSHRVIGHTITKRFEVEGLGAVGEHAVESKGYDSDSKEHANSKAKQKRTQEVPTVPLSRLPGLS